MTVLTAQTLFSSGARQVLRVGFFDAQPREVEHIMAAATQLWTGHEVALHACMTIVDRSLERTLLGTFRVEEQTGVADGNRVFRCRMTDIASDPFF